MATLLSFIIFDNSNTPFFVQILWAITVTILRPAMQEMEIFMIQSHHYVHAYLRQ